MKTLCALLALTVFYLGAFASQSESANKLEVTITDVSPSGIISVKLSNRSKGPVRLWQESNSWGAARWRVMRIKQGQLEILFQNPNQRFTRNVPSFREIASGAEVNQTLDINAGNWCAFGHCASFKERGFEGQQVTFDPGDTVIVTYDVPLTQEASDMGVWYGVIGALRICR